MQNLIMFLQKYNVSPNMAAKVYKIFGSKAVEKIEENPYILAESVDGISFKTSDNIAFVRGMPKNSPERIRAGIKYLLTNAAYMSGHTYMPRSVLIEHCAYKLGVTEDEVANGLSELILSKDLFFDTIENEESATYRVSILTNYYLPEKYSSLYLSRDFITFST